MRLRATPEEERSTIEQWLRFIAFGTLYLSALAGAGVAILAFGIGRGSTQPTDRAWAWVAWPYGLLIFVAGAVTSLWPFAAAQALAYLRRSEERELRWLQIQEDAAEATRRASPREFR